jgi:hypothetical protein
MAGPEQQAGYVTAEQAIAFGKVTSRMFRGSQRKRTTRRREREHYRAWAASVMPDLLTAADAAGLEVDEAKVYAGADAYAQRSYDAQAVEPLRPRATARARESHRGRPGHRRSRSTRAGPSDDDGGSEPPPPRLTLAPKPGALYTYGALALDPDLWREVNS